MNKTFTFFTALCIAVAAHAQVLCKWDAESTRNVPARFDCYRGETLLFAPTYRQYGFLVTNVTETFYWQTNGMGTAWWSTNILQFVPAMDVGASSYTCFIRASMTNGVSYRANGIITMRHAPGYTPNALPLPVQSIDFATVTLTNAPWLLSSAWLSWLSTNTYIKVESDPGIPAALVIASSNAQSLASAAQATAITFAATNPVTRLTGTTNEWVQMVNGTATVYRVTYTNTAAYILLGYNNPNTPNGAPPSTYYRFASLTPIDFMPGMSRGDLGSEWILEVNNPEGYPAESYTAVYNPSYSIYWMTNNVTIPTLIPANQAYTATGYWVLSHEQVAVTNLYPLATTAQIPTAVDAVTNNQSAVSFSNVTATGTVTIGGVERNTWPESGSSAPLAWTPIQTVASASIATVRVTSARSIYYVESSTAVSFTNDLSSWSFNCTTNVSWTIVFNCTGTNAYGSTNWLGCDFVGGPPEITCTGRYEYACDTSCGIRVRVRQTYPTVYQWQAIVQHVGGQTYSSTAQRFNYYLTSSVSNQYWTLSHPFPGRYSLLKLEYWCSGTLPNGFATAGYGYQVSSVYAATFLHTNSLNSAAVTTAPRQVTFAIPPSPSSYTPVYFFQAGTSAFPSGNVCFQNPLAKPMDENQIPAYNAGWRPN